MPTTLPQYAIQAVLFLTGASLAVNSFLVKEKVGEILFSLKDLSAAYYKLEVQAAVRDQLMSSLSSRQEISETRLQKCEDNIKRLEIRLGKD